MLGTEQPIHEPFRAIRCARGRLCWPTMGQMLRAFPLWADGNSLVDGARLCWPCGWLDLDCWVLDQLTYTSHHIPRVLQGFGFGESFHCIAGVPEVFSSMNFKQHPVMLAATGCSLYDSMTLPPTPGLVRSICVSGLPAQQTKSSLSVPLEWMHV